MLLVAIITIGLVVGFFVYDLRYGRHYLVLDLSLDELERIQEARKDFIRRNRPRRQEPRGPPLFRRSVLTRDGLRVHRNGVMARFGRARRITFPWYRDLVGTHTVLERRYRFVPFELLSGVYPVEVSHPAYFGWTDGVATEGIQFETRDFETLVVAYGADPVGAQNAIKRAMGPWWRRLFEGDDPVVIGGGAGEGEEAGDEWHGASSEGKHKLLRGPRKDGDVIARPVGVTDPRAGTYTPADPFQPMGSLDVTLMELDDIEVSLTSERGFAKLTRWMDGLLAGMQVPMSVEEGGFLDLSTQEKETVDLMVEKVLEARRRFGHPVGTTDLYLRLGNVLDKVDLSREYDVLGTLQMFRVEIRQPGGLERSLEMFDMASELDPGRAEAWLGKARVLEDLGRDEEAGECYQRLIEIAPEEGRERWQVRRLIIEGRFSDAFSISAKAVERDANDREAWYNMGLALNNMGRPEEALGCYERVTRISPRFGRGWYAMGTVLEAMGRKDRARVCYERAFRLGYQGVAFPIDGG